MKTDKEFLDGMWHKVSILEREELEKARIKEINRKLTIKTIYTGICSFIIFIIIALCKQFIAEVIYPITLGVLIVAFSFEYLSMKRLEEGRYGNSNIESY